MASSSIHMPATQDTVPAFRAPLSIEQVEQGELTLSEIEREMIYYADMQVSVKDVAVWALAIAMHCVLRPCEAPWPTSIADLCTDRRIAPSRLSACAYRRLWLGTTNEHRQPSLPSRCSRVTSCLFLYQST